MAVDVDPIIERFEKAKSRRALWDSHWGDIADVVWPSASEFNRRRVPGERLSDQVYDPTAALDLEKFAAALESLLTPRDRVWHKLMASESSGLNRDQSVKRWFDQVNEILFAERNNSKSAYYSQTHLSYKSLGAFGNQCLFIDEPDQGGIRYRHIFIGQLYIETNPDNEIDTVFRHYRMTAKAAAQKWGREAITESISRAMEVDPGQEFEFLHVVVPRIEGFDPERVDAEGMPFMAVDIQLDDRQPLDDGGFAENPYIYSRYTVHPSEMHGRGPAMLVLPAIHTSNEIYKDTLRAGHLASRPPLLAADDDVLGYGSVEVDLRAGGITWGGVDERGNPRVIPLNTGAQPALAEGLLERQRVLVNEAFLVPFFQTVRDDQDPTATAFELAQRAKERSRVITPLIGRQQTELLQPQIERELGILERQGRLPARPPALLEAEGEFEIEYVTEAARDQKIDEATGILQVINDLGPLIEFEPSLLGIFRGGEAVRRLAEIRGVDSRLLLSEEEFAEQQQAAREAAAAAQQAEQAPGGARALRDTAEGLRALGVVPGEAAV